MAEPGRYSLLDQIDSPAALRDLSLAELTQLSAELRDFLIHTVSTRGGHFAAGLGSAMQRGQQRLVPVGAASCVASSRCRSAPCSWVPA